jgi:hypothetical protein
MIGITSRYISLYIYIYIYIYFVSMNMRMDGIFFWQDGWIPKEGLKEPCCY